MILNQSTYKGGAKFLDKIQSSEPKERKKPTPWKKKPLNEMIQHVQDNFVNPYIRDRDQVNFGKCISSNGGIQHAGHYYSVGSHPGLRFRINNIHGQSIYSNMHKHGDLLNYRMGLISRHGVKYVDALERDESIYKQYGHRWTTIDVILIGETYKYLKHHRKWIYDTSEFEKIKLEIAKTLKI